MLLVLLPVQARGDGDQAGENSDGSGAEVTHADAGGKLAQSCPRLSPAEDSVDALARKVLETLAQGDRDKLEDLALTQQEFTGCIYPALPASRPGSNLSADFLWSQTLLRNLAGLEKTLGYAGRRFEFVSIRFADGERQYEGFKVLRDARLTVKDTDGKELELKLFGAVLEAGGKFKIYSFAH
jgi:hypothetical protein